MLSVSVQHDVNSRSLNIDLATTNLNDRKLEISLIKTASVGLPHQDEFTIIVYRFGSIVAPS